MGLEFRKLHLIVVIAIYLVSPTLAWCQTVDSKQELITQSYQELQTVVRDFCEGWRQGHYHFMYDVLSPAAKGRQSENAFVENYQNLLVAPGAITLSPLLPMPLVLEGKMQVAVFFGSNETRVNQANGLISKIEILLDKDPYNQWKINRIHIPPIRRP